MVKTISQSTMFSVITTSMDSVALYLVVVKYKGIQKVLNVTTYVVRPINDITFMI